MKTVTLPIEEYNELLREKEDKERLMEELAKDAHDRGFFVQQILHMWRKSGYGWESEYENIKEKNTLNIVSSDAVLVEAQKEIDRLVSVNGDLSEKVRRLQIENTVLRSRGFLARLFNRPVCQHE